MTRKKAINELSRLRDYLKNTRIEGEINLDSLDIAIDALKEGEESDNIHLICPHCYKDLYYKKITQTFEEGEK